MRKRVFNSEGSSFFQKILEKRSSVLTLEHFIRDLVDFCLDLGLCLAVWADDRHAESRFCYRSNADRIFGNFFSALLASEILERGFDDVSEKNIVHGNEKYETIVAKNPKKSKIFSPNESHDFLPK